jgi:translation initiation factor 2 alpha subunit (eIF-2alpha)
MKISGKYGNFEILVWLYNGVLNKNTDPSEIIKLLQVAGEGTVISGDLKKVQEVHQMLVTAKFNKDIVKTILRSMAIDATKSGHVDILEYLLSIILPHEEGYDMLYNLYREAITYGQLESLITISSMKYGYNYPYFMLEIALETNQTNILNYIIETQAQSETFKVDLGAILKKSIMHDDIDMVNKIIIKLRPYLSRETIQDALSIARSIDNVNMEALLNTI